ncbi:hypothetical protein AHF37_09215 [Paragonimus kellicotti]|nr:hypothetical protein AHF37_09215 [Paragonimus kellicotti]
MGTSTLSVYDGRFLAARQNVIVVSLNYRVGPFGFLYMENEEVPGNMGLWDQRLAMKWVKENIDVFGGDPERITLFGESAGAVSVSTHVLSPWSHAYFTNAIMQSGSVFGYWALVTNTQALNRTKQFAKHIGCPNQNAADLITCMRKKSVNELLDAHDAMFDPASYFFVPFPPVLDNHFLPYENGHRFQQMLHLKPTGALMYGVNKNEGSYFLLYAFVKSNHWHGDKTQLPIANREDYLNCLRRVLDLNNDDNPEITEPLVRYTDFQYETYTHLFHHALIQPSLASWTERLEMISSDRSFKCPTIKMATAVTNENRISGNRRAQTLPVYFYEFQHRTQSVQWPAWTGTMHGYEIEYVFGIPYSPQFQATYYRFTDEERKLSDMMMTYWANFARTGFGGKNQLLNLIQFDTVPFSSNPNSSSHFPILSWSDPNILPHGKQVMDLNQADGDDGDALLVEPEQRLKQVIDYLTEAGLPASLSRSHLISWPQYHNKSSAFLIFKEDPGHLSVGTKPRKRECLFWHRWYPILLQETNDQPTIIATAQDKASLLCDSARQLVCIHIQYGRTYTVNAVRLVTSHFSRAENQY